MSSRRLRATSVGAADAEDARAHVVDATKRRLRPRASSRGVADAEDARVRVLYVADARFYTKFFLS